MARVDPETDEPKDDDDEAEVQMECPYCDGTGESKCDIGGGTITMDCPECGGTGWY